MRVEEYRNKLLYQVLPNFVREYPALLVEEKILNFESRMLFVAISLVKIIPANRATAFLITPAVSLLTSCNESLHQKLRKSNEKILSVSSAFNYLSKENDSTHNAS